MLDRRDDRTVEKILRDEVVPSSVKVRVKSEAAVKAGDEVNRA